ncbi:MAG: ABC transporter substrate-binding protein [Chloroflexi bacterium]|nr:ABC transporter substrate-binding protein [Chloroflexota bacterium]MBU1746154.1 ABC transporter substrate-binding protein [Chloroflexota bacterium]
MIYIGIDDTDVLDGPRGTGRLARDLAAALGDRYGLRVRGVTRHQFLLDPRIPYTAKNSGAAIHLHADGPVDLGALADEAAALMRAAFQPGSDPGLCVARDVPSAITAWGRLVQTEVVAQDEARALAAAHGLSLHGLGGTADGIIGALAAVGLAASGDDGRWVLVGRARELAGVVPVAVLLDAGIDEVRALDNTPVHAGLVDTQAKLRPALRGGRVVLFVKVEPAPGDGLWRACKVD